MTKPVEAITVRLDTSDAMRLNEAAAMLHPREATRAKQIKRVIAAFPALRRTVDEKTRRVEELEQALDDLAAFRAAADDARLKVADAEGDLEAATLRAVQLVSQHF